MKRLLVFHPALAPYRIDFFNYLDEHFDAQFYFSTTNLRNQKFDQATLRKRCTFEVNILKNGFELGGRLLHTGIISLIRKASPDIVLCSEYSQITLAVLFYKRFFRPQLKVYTYSIDSVDVSTKRRGMRKWVQSFAAKYLDGIILASPKMRDWFHENVNRNIVTFDVPTSSENGSFRKRLLHSIPTAEHQVVKNNLLSKKIFLFVGRLAEVKNLEVLIKAFAEAKIKDKVLVIVGEGELMGQLSELIEDLNISRHVIFTGRLEGVELMAWYNIAECFVLPSYYEPFGAVVNEALLGGCKVICSALAGAAELINEDNGVLFDPHNQQQLTEEMERAGSYMKGVTLPLRLREDRMPFQLEEKFKLVTDNL